MQRVHVGLCVFCVHYAVNTFSHPCHFHVRLSIFFVLFSNFIKAGIGFNRLLRRVVRALFCHLLFFFFFNGGWGVGGGEWQWCCFVILRSATDAADESVLWFIAGSLWPKAHLSLAILWPCPPHPTSSAPSPCGFWAEVARQDG